MLFGAITSVGIVSSVIANPVVPDPDVILVDGVAAYSTDHSELPMLNQVV